MRDGPAVKRLYRNGRKSYGLIHRRDLAAAGLTPKAIRYRVRCGELREVLPGVFAHPSVPDSWEQRLAAGCMWAGDGSAGCGGAAARTYRWAGFSDAPIEIATVGAKKPSNFVMKVRRVDSSLLTEIRRVRGIPVTSPCRTLLDLAGAKHPRTERALDQALRERAVAIPGLALFFEREWERRPRGMAFLRTLLEARVPEFAMTHSALEDMFLRRIRRVGLPTPKPQYFVTLASRAIHVDFAYPKRGWLSS